MFAKSKPNNSSALWLASCERMTNGQFSERALQGGRPEKIHPNRCRSICRLGTDLLTKILHKP
jgi:hypothetical protein